MVLSYLLVAVPLVTLTPQSRGSNGSTLTCDATQIHADSYRLTTEAQALNLTRPRTNWWDAFDVTLSPYRDALADINEGALAIAERALEIDDRNLLGTVE